MLLVVVLCFIERAQAEEKLTRDFIRVTLEAYDNPRRISVHILNDSKVEQRLVHPGDRQALKFFVSDDLGNSVAPVGRAKVDPPTQTIVIAAGETYTHKLDDLEFLTGSALFGFDLKHAATYRVIAVYRPVKGGTGVTSPEVNFTVK